MGNDTIRSKMKIEEIGIELEKTTKLLDEFDEKHFICNEGNKTFIYTETTDENGRFKLSHLAEKDFLRMYNEFDVYGPNLQNRLAWQGIASFWLESYTKRKYEGIIFKPKYNNGRFYNLWNGFCIAKNLKGGFPFIEYHLKNIWCDGNNEYYEYLLKWFAHLVQYPEERPGIALVIKGEKGTGKSTFIDVLAKAIFGHMYIHVASARHLTGDFNSHLFAKLLVVADEAIWAGDKRSEGKLKSMITDATSIIERKGIDAVDKDSYIRLIFLTNEEYSVPATYDERRFFAIKISNKCKNDKDYFKNLYEGMEQNEIIHFFNYLKEYKFDKLDVLTPPASKALFEDVKAGMDVFDRWLYNLIDCMSSNEHKYSNDEFDWISASSGISFSKKVLSLDLYKSYMMYIQHLKSNNIYFKGTDISKTMLTQKLTNGKDGSYTFIKGRSALGTYIDMPSPNKAKDIFSKKFSCVVEWSNENIEVSDFFDSQHQSKGKSKKEELFSMEFLKQMVDEAEDS